MLSPSSLTITVKSKPTQIYRRHQPARLRAERDKVQATHFKSGVWYESTSMELMRADNCHVYKRFSRTEASAVLK